MDFYDIKEFVLWPAFCFVVCGIIILISVLSRNVNLYDHPVTIQICSADMSEGSSDDFVIEIEEDDVEYYSCFEKNSSGGKDHIKFPVEQTEIYAVLSAGEKPYVEIKNKLIKDQYRLYVPKNAVVQPAIKNFFRK